MHHLANHIHYMQTLIHVARQLVCITFFAMPMHSCRAAEPHLLTITVLGDSLTAGYGLDGDSAFPARLQVALQEAGRSVTVINAGVSGDTTAVGLSRLDWVLQEEPDVLIIQLGANDALRGLSPQRARANLDEMITRTKARGIQVILAGMLAPMNLGLDYRKEFNPIYPELAKQHNIPIYPFFLEGVAGKTELNLPDGIHPNSEGIDEIVRRFTPFLLRQL